jgi:hypothetical protein
MLNDVANELGYTFLYYLTMPAGVVEAQEMDVARSAKARFEIVKFLDPTVGALRERLAVWVVLRAVVFDGRSKAWQEEVEREITSRPRILQEPSLLDKLNAEPLQCGGDSPSALGGPAGVGALRAPRLAVEEVSRSHRPLSSTCLVPNKRRRVQVDHLSKEHIVTCITQSTAEAALGDELLTIADPARKQVLLDGVEHAPRGTGENVSAGVSKPHWLCGRLPTWLRKEVVLTSCQVSDLGSHFFVRPGLGTA